MPPKLADYLQQHQCKSFWCWAAVAVSLVRYFEPASKLTQCAFALQVLNRDKPTVPAECCGAGCTSCGESNAFFGPSHKDHHHCPGPPECDQKAFPATVLDVLKQKHGLTYQELGVGKKPEAEIVKAIRNEVVNDRPVVIWRSDKNTNGHLIVVIGIKGENFMVTDPEGDFKEYDPNANLLAIVGDPDLATYIWVESYALA